MNSWKNDITTALDAFKEVVKLAGDKLNDEEITVEYLEKPNHKQPKNLPKGKMAVYGFYYNGQWLKIGEAGPKSNPRYTSQHYTGSAMSTLSGSIVKDPHMRPLSALEQPMMKRWIENNTNRVNILISSERSKYLRYLLEVFLQCRLKPKYEGKQEK
jgi:hypothetical protein